MTLSRRFLCIGMTAALCATIADTSSAASQLSQLVGAWALVSETHTSNGTTSEPFGSHPIGIAIYDRSGHFSTQRMREDLPKFAANSKNGGTDAENKAVVQGIMTLFGTFTVDEKSRTRLLHIAGSSYPNIIGTDLKETMMFKGDLMTIVNPVSTLVWKRLK